MSPATSPSQPYISVAVPVPLHGVFDYKIDPQTAPGLSTGSRVLVRFGNRLTIGIVTEQKKTPAFDPSKIRQIEASYIEPPPFEHELMHLIRWASSYYSHPLGECFGAALPLTLKKPQPRPNHEVVRWQRSAKDFTGRNNAHRQLALLDAVGQCEDGVWEDTLKSMGFKNSLIQRMHEDGYLERNTSPLVSKAMQIKENKASYTLNDEQQEAVQQLTQTTGFQASLLEGVTGSGKTEVYIALARHHIIRKQQVLILVPEINLAPQTFRRFQSQLGIPIAIYHSGMSEKEKFITYSLVQDGEAQVVIGTRSSIFLPFRHLGLIVVDEEHDSSFKQMDGFKYSARDLAVKRAQLNECSIVLGSATPSGETLANAEAKRFNWLKLNTRANSSSMPRVIIEDMRHHKKAEQFAPRVLEAIKSSLDAGDQVIVFQNRRGFAPSLMCFDCGWLCTCPSCDARLTVHTKPVHLHCHHCDFKSQLPNACPNCQHSNLQPVGSGTERLEQTLNYYFPNTRSLRMDRDQIKNQSDLDKTLGRIHSGEPAIIVGTQMLVKGHDFPNVTLVVITDADGLFFSSDYRAFERGTQQLLQVAGRTGRGSKAGRVIIQTRQPEHELFEHVCSHNYLAFMRQELETRRSCNLPPFSKMLSVRSESRSEALAVDSLSSIKNGLSSTLAATTLVAGPMPAAISRKQNTYRYLLHIFCDSTGQRAQIQSQLLQAIAEFRESSLKISLDVDPLEFI